jgi:hypothetical protein
VPFHGLLADAQVLGDGLIGRAGDDACQHLTLAWGDLGLGAA